MADFSDVSDTFAALIAGMLYPGGTGAAAVTGSGYGYTIMPGWPESKCLESQLAQGNVQISIYPVKGEKNTTRFDERLHEYSRTTKTLTATVAANQVTFGGAITTPQNVSIICNDTATIYALQAGDTLATIATALATLLTAKGIAASSAGSVLTISGAVGLIQADVGVIGKLWVELKRQVKMFQITIWAPTPGKRAAAAKVIDPGLAGLHWLQLPDFTAGRNIYVRGDDDDGGQEVLAYRRDLIYAVEYPTIKLIDGTEVVSVQQGITPTLGAMDEIVAPVTQINTGG